MIRAIIVDDEQPATDALKNYITEFCPDVLVVALADSVRTAMEAISVHNPDLVFLDVEMPNGNGFDLLKQYDHIPFKIIFVTAYSEYAVKAFRFFATDYLMKPINIKELKEAVQKVKKELESHVENINLNALTKFIKGSSDDIKSIIICDVSGFRVIELDTIIKCEANGYCTDFFLLGGKKITSSKNLKHYEDLLSGSNFIRVHNSFVVNMNYVKGYLNEGTILLIENQSAHLGNTYKKRFLKLFQKK